jgi:hypothetical protein
MYFENGGDAPASPDNNPTPVQSSTEVTCGVLKGKPRFAELTLEQGCRQFYGRGSYGAGCWPALATVEKSGQKRVASDVTRLQEMPVPWLTVGWIAYAYAFSQPDLAIAVVGVAVFCSSEGASRPDQQLSCVVRIN